MELSSILHQISQLPPALTIFVGALLLGITGYVNWHGDLKARSVHWIATKVQRSLFGTEDGANGLFMTITSLVLAAGGILVLFGLTAAGL